MSDAIGLSWLPAVEPATAMKGLTRVVTDRAPGDPALVTLGSYLATVMQSQLNDAWLKLHTSSAVTLTGSIDGTRDGVGVVRDVYFHDPSDGALVSANLPALFVYRGTKQPAQFKRIAADAHRRIQPISCTWVAAPVDISRQRENIDPFVNSVNGSMHFALTWKRHPSWVIAADERDLDGLKTSFATSTSAQVITVFNGALADATMVSARPVAITVTAAAGAYSTGNITVEGTDKNGAALTVTMNLTTANGGETIVSILRFATVTRVTLPAMALTTGSITIGYYDSPDKRFGSLVQRACAFSDMRLLTARYLPFQVVREKELAPLTLLGLEATIEVHEDSIWDADVHAINPYTFEAHVQHADGTDFSELEIP